MNQTEKRRQRLLEYTRNQYTDRRNVPAIHPRYKAAYYQVYEDDRKLPKSTFGMRLGISMILLAVYIVMKQNDMEVLGINNLQVLDTIVHNFQIKLY